jgi:flagellar assembly protein FliH
MSLSEAGKTAHTGRVFIGVDTPGPDSMSIQELEGKKQLTWDGAMDKEFISRVRSKAQGMAKEIIAKAMQEAELIREKAHQEGVSQGLSEGERLLQEQLDNTAAGLGQVLESIRQQADTVWEARKADLIQLIHAAVETTLGVELAERRAEILELLLRQALDRLESDRFLTLRCAPEDTDLLDELLQKARQTNPKLLKWMVRPDSSMTAGVVVEAENAKVENGVDGRWEGVRVILDQLTLRQPDVAKPGGER